MENKFTEYYRQERQYINDIQRSLAVNPIEKLIYYKPGKCAGTSIFRTILQPMGDWIVKKDDGREFGQWIKDITDEEMDKYFSFIFVRNPFSRLVSAWNDTLRPRGHTDFKKFVKEDVFRGSGYRGRRSYHRDIPTQLHFQTQSGLVEVPDGSKNNLNFIGKVENINDDWEELCSKIHIPHVPMVHAKNKRHEYGNYKDYYDEETIELVSDMYRRDLQIFNYKWS